MQVADIDDDLTRELAFYNQASLEQLSGVLSHVVACFHWQWFYMGCDVNEPHINNGCVALALESPCKLTEYKAFILTACLSAAYCLTLTAVLWRVRV